MKYKYHSKEFVVFFMVSQILFVILIHQNYDSYFLLKTLRIKIKNKINYFSYKNFRCNLRKKLIIKFLNFYNKSKNTIEELQN